MKKYFLIFAAAAMTVCFAMSCSKDNGDNKSGKETNQPQQIQPQQGEADNPNRQIDIPVKQMPVIGLVRNAEELQAEGNFDEA